jgi:glutamate-1-semialdehyde 2,1-aminomutase
VIFCNTGTEATMYAIRAARAFTGKAKIAVFEGSYHGAHDYVLWSNAHAPMDEIGDRNQPVSYKTSRGIPEVMRSLIQLCPWNDVEVLGDILQRRGEEIAAIIVEPVLGNAAAMHPSPGYFEFLRAQCDHYGIVLIFDEVKTGFRLAPGGAGEYFGVLPDISTFAKAMGNGYPIAAIGGKRDIMMGLGPGQVFQGGTYTGNVVSTAAADATLEYMQTGKVFAQLNKVGGMLMAGLAEILKRHSVPHNIHGTPAMFGISLMDTNPRDWRDLQAADWNLYEAIVTYMINHGVMPEPDGLEPWFLCADHTEADAAETLQAFEDGLKHALAK